MCRQIPGHIDQGFFLSEKNTLRIILYEVLLYFACNSCILSGSCIVFVLILGWHKNKVVYNVFVVHKLYYIGKGVWYDDKKWKNVYTAFYFVYIPILWTFVEHWGRGSGAGFPGGGVDGGFHWKNLI